MSDAYQLLARLPSLAQRWRTGEIDDAHYAAQYFLYGQIAFHGVRFASRRYKDDARPDFEVWLANLDCAADEDVRAGLLHYLGRYHFLGVIPNVPAALCAWLNGRWSLYVCEYVPWSIEVLRTQANGRRPVTLIGDYPRLLQPMLKKPNAWAFMIHDLEHAYKFFNDADLYQDQKRFFERIACALEMGYFERPLNDRLFAEKFDYLISDMNTHSQHSLQYLRAILIEFYLRQEGKPLRAALSPASQAELNRVVAQIDSESKAALTKRYVYDTDIGNSGVRDIQVAKKI